MIKSPLRYPGGKSKAIKFLKEFVPDEFNEYREPFFGGGSFGFYIQQNYTVKKLIANDLNYELYAFWLSAKENLDELCGSLIKILNSQKNGKKLYAEIMERRTSNLTILERGIDFFILNRITFSGIADSGGYSEESFQKRFTQSSIQRLKESGPIINAFEVHNEDYKKIIQKNGKDVFLYLDPPYYSVNTSKLYGKNGDLHIGFNHEDLFNMLSKTNHKFLMTYDNCEYISNLYVDFYQNNLNLQYAMNNVNKNRAQLGKELIISNYPLAKNGFFDNF